MISLWIYVTMTLLLTIGYILLIIYVDGSIRHVTCKYILITFLLCAAVSTMFLTAIDCAIDISNGGCT